jgi:hypothetical protein
LVSKFACSKAGLVQYESDLYTSTPFYVIM